MDIYKHFIRPLLFSLDAERAHNMAGTLLRHPHLLRLFVRGSRQVKDDRLKVDAGGGLFFPGPVGLSAGFDKDCDMLSGLMSLGFGYLVCGSVMYNPRPGNPRPRMIRAPEQKGLYSCMGLPSRGLEYSVRMLKKRRPGKIPVIVNMNAENFDEYLKEFDSLQPLGDATEVTLFCPNRPQDAGDFLSPEVAGRLLKEIADRKEKPLFIKIPGYREESDRHQRLKLVEHILQYPVDGITITPESLLQEDRLSIGRGTITGRPTFGQALKVVRDVYGLTGKEFCVKISGGVFTGQHAFEVISAGASSVELYTGLIYEGWNIARNIHLELIDLMVQNDIENVQELRGSE